MNAIILFRYVRANPVGVWGAQTENGSWTGMVRSIVDGDVTTSVAGTGVTAERFAVLDYPSLSVKSNPRVFVRRPKATDLSVGGYVDEFTNGGWTSLFLYLIFISFVMAVIMFHTHEKCLTTKYKLFLASINITLR